MALSQTQTQTHTHYLLLFFYITSKKVRGQNLELKKKKLQKLY